jgi:3-oxoacyl-[acyl-carrier-protein] synthase-3
MMNNLYLKAIDICEPDSFLTSKEVEDKLSSVYERLKLPFGRIEMQTGISSRGLFKNKLPSYISAKSAQNLFKNNNIDPKSIDLLIHASVCRDFLEPSTASVIHDSLGLRADCLSFDLSNACLGVVSSIELAQKFSSPNINNILIVTGENATPLITKTLDKLVADNSITKKEFKKYFANFTIGSAGVAMVVTTKNKDTLAEFGLTQSLSDTSAHRLCQGGGSMDGLEMQTDSEELMLKGVELAKKNWVAFLEKSQRRSFDHYICHQVGVHHQKYLYEQLELDISCDHSTYPKYGNTGSAALPLTLYDAYKANKLNKDDKIALLGIGSGLHTSMMELKWN